MKRLFLMGLLAAACVVRAGAAHVVFAFDDATLYPQGVKTFYLYPLTATTSGAVIVTRDRVVSTTATDGTATVSNLVAGLYRAEFKGAFSSTTNTLAVPDTNGLVSAAAIIGVNTNLPSGLVAYSQAQSDGKYLQGVTAGSTNVHAATTNGIVTLTVDASGGGGGLTSLVGDGSAITNVQDRVKQLRYYLVCDGDSLTASNATTGTSWPMELATAFTNWNGKVMTNAAHGGDDVAAMQAKYASAVRPWRPISGGSNVFLSVAIGANNMFSSNSWVATWTNLWNYATNAQADGFKTIVWCVPPSTLYSNAVELNRQAFNQQLKRNAGSFYQVLDPENGWGWDPANGTMSYDGRHPTALGSRIFATNVAIALSYAPAFTPINIPTMPVTPSYLPSPFLIGGIVDDPSSYGNLTVADALGNAPKFDLSVGGKTWRQQFVGNDWYLTEKGVRHAIVAQTTTGRIGLGGQTSPAQMLDISGSAAATSFIGSGAGLSNIPNSALNFVAATNGANINTGALTNTGTSSFGSGAPLVINSSGALTANSGMTINAGLAVNGAISSTNTISTSGQFAGNGAGITNLYALPNSMSIMAFGAIGDGVTDNTVAISNADWFAAQSNWVVYIPPGKFLASNLTATASAWVGQGTNSVLVYNTNCAGPFVSSIGKTVTFRSFALNGNSTNLNGFLYATNAFGSRVGIRHDPNGQSQVYGMNIYGFDNAGIEVAGTVTTARVNLAKYTENWIQNCYFGFTNRPGCGEYITISGNWMGFNTVGLSANAPNMIIDHNTITDNNTSAYWGATLDAAHRGHSKWLNNSFHHQLSATPFMIVSNLTGGLFLNNSMMGGAGGPITVSNCVGIVVANNIFQGGGFTVDASGNANSKLIVFHDNIWYGTLGGLTDWTSTGQLIHYNNFDTVQNRMIDGSGNPYYTAGGAGANTGGVFTVRSAIASYAQASTAPLNIWTNVATVSTSWTNITIGSGYAIVGGGTVSAISINGTSLGVTAGTFPLNIGGYITVAYTVAPTMKWVYQ